MKNFVNLFFAIFLSFNLFSQAEEKAELFDVQAHYKDGEVRLRWLVTDQDMFEWSLKSGYRIERVTKSIGGVNLNNLDRINSRIILESNFKPLSQEEFATKPAGNDYLGIAEDLLYDPRTNDLEVAPGEVSLAAAVEAEQAKESKHFMSMMAAEMDFEAACSLGMGYSDTSVAPNTEYIYYVSLAANPKSSYTKVAESNFETGWGIWNDSGADNWIHTQLFPKSGDWTIQLNDNTPSSQTQTKTLAMGGAKRIKFKYSVLPHKIDAGDHCEFLISYDGGLNFETFSTIHHGTELSHNVRYEGESIITSDKINNHVVLKIDAKVDYIYDYFMFDDIEIYTSNTLSGDDFELFHYSDFEDEWYIWQDAGNDCRLRRDNFGSQGLKSLILKKNTFCESDPVDMSAYENGLISYMTRSRGFAAGEKIKVLASADGQNYTLLKEYAVGYNGVQGGEKIYDRLIVPKELLSATTHFRFESESSSTHGHAVFDEVLIEGSTSIIDPNTLASQAYHENQYADYFTDFNRSWGFWNDMGGHSHISTNSFNNSGVRGIVLRDNDSNSNTTTGNLALQGKKFLNIGYSVFFYNVQNGDSYNLQISTDGGASFTTVKTWNLGTDFKHFERHYKKEQINCADLGLTSFNNNVKLRLQSLCSAANKYVVLDDVEISASVNANDVPDIINFNDFENGWGIWTDGGWGAWLRNDVWLFDAPRVAWIRYNGVSARIDSDRFDLSKESEVSVSFKTYMRSMENGEYFEFQVSTDNGATFTPWKRWTVGDEGVPSTGFLDGHVVVPEFMLSDQSKFRFQNFGNETNDFVFFDLVHIKGAGPVHKKGAQVNTTSNTSLPVPNLISATGEVGQIELEWDITDEAELYSSYDIERSENNGPWIKINPIPYVYAADADLIQTSAIYLDKMAIDGNSYRYRVCGKSSFGHNSGPSNILTASTIPPALFEQVMVNGQLKNIPYNATIESVNYDAITDNALISWPNLSAALESDIDHYDIYRSRKATGPFTKLNSTPLLNTTYNYTDINPMGSAYYKIITHDLNGRQYTSGATLLQLPDEQAPDVPVITSVYFVSDYEVTVEWNPVVAEDLFGYRIYFANKLDGNYMQETEVPVAGNKYSFYIDQGISIEEVYVKLTAEDRRGNQSALSAAVAADRPDLHAPSAPLISKIGPTPNGIEVSWVYSSDDDVTKHILQRRPSNAPTWMDLVEVATADQANYPSGDMFVSYTDSLYETVQEYEYRFIAYDEAFNAKASDPARATPSQKQIQGNVSNVDVDMDSEVNLVDPDIQEQLDNVRDKNVTADFLKSNNISKKHTITLSWDYILDPNLKEFKIYRAMSGGRMSLYRTVSIGSAMGYGTSEVEVSQAVGNRTFTFIDDELIENRRYVYEIKAVHKDGSVSYRSSQVSQLVPRG